MARLTPLDKIYEQYKTQIDAIVDLMDKNYNRAAIIVAWLYGGASEGWRKFLPKQKTHAMPNEVKELLQKYKSGK